MANGQLARASLVCQTSAGSRSQDTEGRTARLSARSGQRNSLVLRRAFFERGTCGRDEPVANRRAPAVAAALGSGSRSDGHGSASREQDLSEAIVRYQDHYARNGQRINHRHLKANGCEAALDNPTDLRSSNDSTHRFKDPADPSIEEPGELAEISPMQTLKEPMVAKICAEEVKPVQLWKKMIPLGFIFMCASFNLVILQNLRDSIVVTAAGAEVLPFLASYCVLPSSLLFLAFYTRLCSTQQPRHIFYMAITPLLGMYVLFATLLFPASGHLHLPWLTASAASFLPTGLMGAVKVVENWTFSLFFCAAELWGTVVISVLFWTLANEVCTVDEAKTAYPLMGMSANLALIMSGSYIKWVNSGPAAGGIGASLNWLVGTIVVSSGVMCIAKHLIDRSGYISSNAQGAKNSSQETPGSAKATRKRKRGSFRESLEVLRSSPRIGNLALLIIGYGVCHRMFEFAWKGQLRILHPTPQAYQSVLSNVSIATGILSTILMLGGQYVFKYAGWGFAAAATPLILLVTGVIFFGFSLTASYGFAPFGMSTAAVAAAGVFVGAVTQVFARSSKFSLFDPAKEMVYIDMSREEKMEGKAAVDLVGSQIGKSGASWMIQAMLVATGSVAAALPFISIAYMMVLGFWIRAVGVLDKELAGQKAEDSTASESVTELEQVKEVVQGPNNKHSSGSWASSAKLVVMGSTDGRADAPNSSH